MIEIEPMDGKYVEEAVKIALQNYHEERGFVNELPDGDYTELLTAKIEKHVQNGLGVAAMESGNLLGFLSCWTPMKNHFGKALGTFSPIHAHGAVKEKRGEIYSRIYQAAADIWVNNGILSHAVGLYTHDREAVESFFWNGFGLRCIDAVRDLSFVPMTLIVGCEIERVSLAQAEELLPLTNLLRAHLRQTPMFMPLFTPGTLEDMVKWMGVENNYYLAATVNGKIAAYLKVTSEGENFATEAPDMTNICGAYCLPGFRGRGIMQSLLSTLTAQAKADGYQRIGVDFESFNPNAKGFWLKYFKPYTYSVVRRIDERIYRDA